MIQGIIYKAVNRVNGKVYIGQTIKQLEVRMKQHLYDSENKISEKYFCRALRKYGADNFEWSIIEQCTNKDDLSEKESYWIEHYNSFGDGGYNLTSGGERGYVLANESLAKQSEARSKWWAEKSGDYDSALKEEDVLKIKDLLIKGMTQKEISETLNVSPSVIGRIKRGKTWSYLISEEDVSKMSIKTIEDSKAIEIKELLMDSNLSVKEISNLTNTSMGIITKIRNGEITSEKITEKDLEIIAANRKKMLTEEDVLNVKRLLLESNLSQKEISEKLQIEKSIISYIKSGKKFAHLSTEEELNKMKNRVVIKEPKKPFKNIIAEEVGASIDSLENEMKKERLKRDPSWEKKKELLVKDVILIKNLLVEGILSNKEIAYVVGTTVREVGLINTEKKWKDIRTPMWKEYILDNKIRKENKKQRFVGFFVS